MLYFHHELAMALLFVRTQVNGEQLSFLFDIAGLMEEEKDK